MATFLHRITRHLDQLYEFDRVPVEPGRLQGWKWFAALMAGEHVAATEFVIGPLFVIHGVAAVDLVIGLLIGNLLAVLSWTGVTVAFPLTALEYGFAAVLAVFILKEAVPPMRCRGPPRIHAVNEEEAAFDRPTRWRIDPHLEWSAQWIRTRTGDVDLSTRDCRWRGGLIRPWT